MKIFYIDLFSGAGGTTTGIHLLDNPNIRVVACVNHDAKAIESHKANHPECIHFVEDVRDMKVIQHIAALVQVKYPKFQVDVFWGNEPAQGKTLEQIRASKIRAKKAKITEIKNKLEKARLNWCSLFPIEDDPTYQRAIEKLRVVEKELTELNQITKLV